MWHLRHVLEPGAAVEALDAAGDPDDEGWRVTTLRLEPLPVAVHQLLRFGGELEVLEPAELRSAMAGAASELLSRYSPV